MPYRESTEPVTPPETSAERWKQSCAELVRQIDELEGEKSDFWDPIIGVVARLGMDDALNSEFSAPALARIAMVVREMERMRDEIYEDETDEED